MDEKKLMMSLNDYLYEHWSGNKSAFARHINKDRQRVQYMCTKGYRVHNDEILVPILTIPPLDK